MRLIGAKCQALPTRCVCVLRDSLAGALTNGHDEANRASPHSGMRSTKVMGRPGYWLPSSAFSILAWLLPAVSTPAIKLLVIANDMVTSANMMLIIMVVLMGILIIMVVLMGILIARRAGLAFALPIWLHFVPVRDGGTKWHARYPARARA